MIDAAVNLHDKLILVLSGDSIDKDWAENEYNQAVENEMRSGKITLVPVTLDDAVESAEQPWAIKLRRLSYAADFSLWQDSDAYQEVLGYLLKELSTEEEPSNCLEEFNIKDDLSRATEQINSRNMRQEFRA